MENLKKALGKSVMNVPAWLLALAVISLLLTTAAIASYYFSMRIPSVKVVYYGLKVYIDDVEWRENETLIWDTDQKFLSVKSNSTHPARVYVFAVGLPANWTLTWVRGTEDANGTIINPGEWVNGTLRLSYSQPPAPGTYQWDIYVRLSPP